PVFHGIRKRGGDGAGRSPVASGRGALGAGLSLLAPAVVTGAQPAQQPEAVYPRVVPVLPRQPERIVADAFEMGELLPVEVEVLRHRVVALASRAWAPAPQVVAWMGRVVPVLPGYPDPAGALLRGSFRACRV